MYHIPFSTEFSEALLIVCFIDKNIIIYINITSAVVFLFATPANIILFFNRCFVPLQNDIQLLLFTVESIKFACNEQMVLQIKFLKTANNAILTMLIIYKIAESKIGSLFFMCNLICVAIQHLVYFDNVSDSTNFYQHPWPFILNFNTKKWEIDKIIHVYGQFVKTMLN